MSTHYRLDRESFEALLANAFAVQKSGLDEQSLASFVEIQQFIASDGFDFNDEMRMVAESVMKLSKADGVAIALLHANQLLYCAGVGSATKEIGHRITAVLNVSSPGMRQEILRVEDAANDSRIESAICRQFGARSLLVLPIYENRALKGILQVLFDDPHSFVEREIRVYRLMASALEDGILRRQRQVEKHQMLGSSAQASNVEGNPDRGLESGDQTVMSSTFPDSVGHNTFQAHCPKNPANNLQMEQSKESQSYLGVAHRDRNQPSAAVLEAAAGLPLSWSSISLLLCFCLTSSAAMVLVLTLCISSGNHPISSIGYPTTPELRNNQENTKRRPSPAKQEPNRRAPPTGVQRGIPNLKHVRISPYEVDEIAEDVTIRRFATKSIQPEVQRSVKEVNFGNDVTVRYFGHDAPAVFKPMSLRSDRNPKRRQP